MSTEPRDDLDFVSEELLFQFTEVISTEMDRRDMDRFELSALSGICERQIRKVLYHGQNNGKTKPCARQDR